MDVRFSPEQQALRDAAAAVVRDLAATTVAGLDDAERTAKLDAAVAGAGWRELRCASDDAGAPWASGVEVAIVAEELGRGVADTAFLGPTLAAELRRLSGAPAATEPETVVLTADLSGFGTDVGIDAAGAAFGLTVVGAEVRRVELGPATAAADLTRSIATPSPNLPRDRGRLGADRAAGSLDLDRVLALGLATTAADLVGTMQGAVDLACGYAAERRQYGRPVGSFQAVQHLLADALVLTEGSRSAARHAAWAVDALEPAAAVIAGSIALAYAGRSARIVGETAIQVHGGIGNTWECLAHVFLRRTLLSAELFGGIDACLARVLPV
jgi:alkylation response protein AidB-like acyl-CoA dehydrogenase